jgi:hypothetical protein
MKYQKIIADNRSKAGSSWGWKVFEPPRVEPVFPEKHQANQLCRYFSLRRHNHGGEAREKNDSR